jgi:hypothetical protein
MMVDRRLSEVRCGLFTIVMILYCKPTVPTYRTTKKKGSHAFCVLGKGIKWRLLGSLESNP